MKLTNPQAGILRVLVAYKEAVGGVLSAEEIGRRAMPRLGRIAAVSSLRALERKGLVHRLAPRDQWTTAKWASNEAGRSALPTKEATR